MSRTAAGWYRSQRVLLGIDLCDTSVCVVAVDLTGRVVSHAAEEYSVVSLRPGWAETGPHAWIAATAAAIRRCLGDRDSTMQPVAVGISGMQGVVATTASGDPVRSAIVWPDARAAQYLAIHPELTQLRRPGFTSPVTAGMTGPTLAWLVRNEPGSWARTRWVLQPKDWLRSQLTGQFCTEPSDASETLIYDVDAGAWSADVLTALGVRPDVMPRVLHHSGDRAGHVTKRAADIFRLPAGIPVAAGAAGTAAAALGAGLVRSELAGLSLGADARIVTPLGTQRTGPGLASQVHRAATDQGWCATGTVLAAGRALDWVRWILGASRADLHACAPARPRIDDPLFLPHLHGQRDTGLGDTGPTGSWLGLRTQHTRQDLLRAALEGVAFAIKDVADQMLPPHRPAHLRLSGSSSAGENWRQLLADIVQYPLHVPDADDVPGVGAALLGARAADLADEQTILAWVTGRDRLAATPGARYEALHLQRYDRFRASVRQAADRPSSPSVPVRH